MFIRSINHRAITSRSKRGSGEDSGSTCRTLSPAKSSLVHSSCSVINIHCWHQSPSIFKIDRLGLALNDPRKWDLRTIIFPQQKYCRFVQNDDFSRVKKKEKKGGLSLRWSCGVGWSIVLVSEHQFALCCEWHYVLNSLICVRPSPLSQAGRQRSSF